MYGKDIKMSPSSKLNSQENLNLGVGITSCPSRRLQEVNSRVTCLKLIAARTSPLPLTPQNNNKMSPDCVKLLDNCLIMPRHVMCQIPKKLSQTFTSKKRRKKSTKCTNKKKRSLKKKSSKRTPAVVKNTAKLVTKQMQLVEEKEDKCKIDTLDTSLSCGSRDSAISLQVKKALSKYHHIVPIDVYQQALTKYFKAKRVIETFKKFCTCNDRQRKMELINHAENLDAINMEQLTKFNSPNTNSNYNNSDNDPEISFRSPPVELPKVRIELQSQILDSFASSMANQALRPTIVRVQLQNDSPLAMLKKITSSENFYEFNASSYTSMEEDSAKD